MVNLPETVTVRWARLVVGWVIVCKLVKELGMLSVIHHSCQLFLVMELLLGFVGGLNRSLEFIKVMFFVFLNGFRPVTCKIFVYKFALLY